MYFGYVFGCPLYPTLCIKKWQNLFTTNDAKRSFSVVMYAVFKLFRNKPLMCVCVDPPPSPPTVIGLMNSDNTIKISKK